MPHSPPSGQRKRGRAVPPPEPVWTRAELAAYLASAPPGISHLEMRHDRGCPAAGTGCNCCCDPDVTLYTADWQLIARVEG